MLYRDFLIGKTVLTDVHNYFLTEADKIYQQMLYNLALHLRALHHPRALHPRDLYPRALHPRELHPHTLHPRALHLHALHPRARAFFRALHPRILHPLPCIAYLASNALQIQFLHLWFALPILNAIPRLINYYFHLLQKDFYFNNYASVFSSLVLFSKDIIGYGNLRN